MLAGMKQRVPNTGVMILEMTKTGRRQSSNHRAWSLNSLGLRGSGILQRCEPGQFQVLVSRTRLTLVVMVVLLIEKVAKSFGTRTSRRPY